MTTIDEMYTDAELESEFGPSIFIKATAVPDNEREHFLPQFFGRQYMLLGESFVYGWLHKLSPDYQGGLWHFYTLSNGGYYMAPALDCETIRLSWSGNFYEGDMSPDAAGIVATLYALNALMWKTREERIMDLFDKLRDYAGDHAEGPAIFRAID